MKFKLICSLIAASMIFSSVAFAETNAYKEYKRADNTITVSGTTDKSGYARLLVLNPANDNEELNGDERIWAQTVYGDQVVITEDGTFAFDDFSIYKGTVDAPTPVGDYIIRIACGTETVDLPLYYATVEQAVELLDTATNATDITTYITKYNDTYKFDVGEGSSFYSFNADGKNWVLSKLCGAEIPDLVTAQNLFKTYTSLLRVDVETWSSTRDVIDNFQTPMGITVTKYNSLYSDEKDRVANSLAGTLYETPEAFEAAIEEAAQDIIDNRVTDSDDYKETSKDSYSPSFSIGGGGGGGNSQAKEPVTPPVTENNPTFTDVQNHWAKDSIELLYKAGIVNGKENNRFDPESNVTRAEAIKMIILTFADVDNSATSEFSDVATDSWMYPYVSTAHKNGILTGYDDGSSGALNTVTRQDLAVMIVRAARAFGVELKNADNDVLFTDSSVISDYAKEAVSTLRNNNIISGFEDGSFGPVLGTTRAQIAKMLAGFLQ